MSRRGYEFEQRIKDELFTRWHRDNPGNENASLEIHHRVPVAVGKALGIAGHVIKSQANAVALKVEEHRELHANTTFEDFVEIAKQLNILHLFGDE